MHTKMANRRTTISGSRADIHTEMANRRHTSSGSRADIHTKMANRRTTISGSRADIHTEMANRRTANEGWRTELFACNTFPAFQCDQSAVEANNTPFAILFYWLQLLGPPES
jgi:hypothetical protein